MFSEEINKRQVNGLLRIFQGMSEIERKYLLFKNVTK